MKLKFELIYLDTWDTEPVNLLKDREFVLDTLKMEKKEDPITYHLFNGLIGLYEDKKAGKGDYMKNQDDLTSWVIKKLTGSDDGLEIKKEMKEYIQARASYLWTLFEMAYQEGIPTRMPLTNIFNPENPLSRKIKGDYNRDYMMLRYLCE